MPAKLYDGLQLTIKALDTLHNHYMLRVCQPGVTAPLYCTYAEPGLLSDDD